MTEKRSTAKIVRENPWAWLVAVGALGLGGGGATSSYLTSPKDDLKEIKVRQNATYEAVQKLDRRMEKMEDHQENSYQKQEFKVWTLELQRDNPEMKVPSVD